MLKELKSPQRDSGAWCPFNSDRLQLAEDTLAARCREMADTLDTDGDGEITKQEFIKHAMECEFICDMLPVAITAEDE